MPTKTRRGFALGAFMGLAVSATVPTAHGYCLATTCDPSREACLEEQQCVASGERLYWASSCVPFSVQADGSSVHDVDYETFVAIVQQAFATWASADCGNGETPSFRASNQGPATCERPEYNSQARNASVFMFRDDRWPYAGAADALGRTTLQFDRETGEVYDADVEINGTLTPIGTGGESGADLATIVLHEVGHFLGLGHSGAPGAVMTPGYVAGDAPRRELGADDVAAICAAFPPARVVTTESCEPRHGFSGLCAVEQPPLEGEVEPEPQAESSCSLGPRAPRASSRWLLVLAPVVAAAATRRRRSPPLNKEREEGAPSRTRPPRPSTSSLQGASSPDAHGQALVSSGT